MCGLLTLLLFAHILLELTVVCIVRVSLTQSFNNTNKFSHAVEGETYTVHYTTLYTIHHQQKKKIIKFSTLREKKKWKKNFFLHLVNFQTGTKELITMKVCD